nr:hypothetical protein [Tanacetum cinerariifolium]
MSTQQDIYAAGFESRPPMLNKENYVPWSSRLLRYAKNRPNGKLIHNSIINGPYVRRMIPEPGDTNREVPMNETFHVQTNDELTEKEFKQIEADDQAIQTILLGLPKDIYAAVDREEGQVVQRIGKTKDLHTADYTQSCDFLKYNQKEVNELKSERLAKIQDPLALMENSINPYAFLAPHQDQSSFNQNYIQQPMPNPEDITDPTTAMNMALALMAKAFKMNYLTPTNNNQRISSNPRNRQIAQPGMNMGQDRQMQMVGGIRLLRIQEFRMGVGYFARNCTVRPRRRDAAYLQTQLLIAQKEEQASTSGTQTDKAPVYDPDGSAELLEPIPEQHQVPQNDNNVVSEVISVEQNGETVEQHPANFEETHLNKQLSKEKSTVSFLLEEKKKLKSDFKTREDELLDKKIQLEKKIKELNNILVKTGQSIRTIHVLSPKPDSLHHTKQKMALGYQNLFYLKQAQKKQQSLYDGKVLLEKHDPPVVHDSEETLQLAQESREKMKQLNKEIKPANYTKINHLSGVFVSQTAKSREAKFVRDFKSLAKEADESLAKHNALELEIERLLRAVVSQDIMSVVQNTSVVDASNLQTELERTKERFENSYKDMQQKIERLQAQLGDLKGKSTDTSCVPDTRNPLSQKLENENVELEFQDNTRDTSANTKFAKQSIVENLPKVGETHALLKPITSNSVSTPQESKVVKNDKVIAPGMFRINPFKTSREEKHVPNTVRASDKTKPITLSQPPVFTKKDMNSDSNGLSSTGVDNTKTRRPQPRSNAKNDRVPSASKSSRSKNKGVEVEEHHRNLLLSNNTKHMSSACNNIKLDSQNPEVKKTKKVGFIERLATPKPRKTRFLLRWSPTGRMFDLNGKIIASSESESQSDYSKGDNACTSNTLEPKIKRFPNSTSLLGFGDLQWGNILITRVYFVEGLGRNLFSVGQLCDSDLEVAFSRNACFVRNLEGVDLLKGDRSLNLYTINLHEMASASPICLMDRASSTKNDLVSGLPKFKYNKEHLCPSCEQGKSKRASHPPKPVPNSRQRLHLLHMDLCGPIRIASINRKRSKDEAPEVIKTFLKRITVLLQYPVIIIRTDNGTEFKNQVLKEYYDSVGISHQVSSVQTPQQNGVVEHRNQTLVEAARTMLIFSRASLFLWAEAIATACFTQNRSIIHHRFNKTPYELINDIGKLGAKGDIGFFIGYSADSCADKIYNRRTKKIMETMNVSFDELSAMAFEQRSLKPGLQSMTSGQISLGLDLTYAPLTITTQQPTEGELDLLFEAMYDDYISGQLSATAKTVTASQEPQDVDELNPNAMFDGNLFVNPFANPSISATESSSSQNNVKEAMTDPAWIDSMQEELFQFKRLDAKPTEKHLKEVKRIFCYLWGTVNTGHWYLKDSGFELTRFSDADYAGCKDTFKSTSGGAQFLGEKLVSWPSKKQDCTTLSIAEAKYVSLSACCAQVLCRQTQLTDYGFHFKKIPIYCDSKSAIAISYNPTDYQLADLFTKALPADRFNYLVRRLGIRSLSPHELDRLAKSQGSFLVYLEKLNVSQMISQDTLIDFYQFVLWIYMALLQKDRPTAISQGVKRWFRISRRHYNLIPAESKFKTPCSIIKDKYMMKAQLHVSKFSAISDVQALPQKKHY